MTDNDRPNKPIDVLLYSLHWLAFVAAAVCVLSAAASAQGMGNGPTAMWEVHPRSKPVVLPLITSNGTMTTQPYVTSFNPLCPPDYVLVAVSRSTYKCAKDLVDPQ